MSDCEKISRGVAFSSFAAFSSFLSWQNYQWIGLRENLNRKPSIFPWNMGFPVIFPLNQSIEIRDCPERWRIIPLIMLSDRHRVYGQKHHFFHGKKTTKMGRTNHPRCSMYGIFTYIYPKNNPNVGKYSIHGASGHGYSTTGLDSGKKICHFLEDTSNTNNAQSGHEKWTESWGNHVLSAVITCVNMYYIW